MRAGLTTTAVLGLVVLAVGVTGCGSTRPQSQPGATSGKSETTAPPLRFEPNLGQSDPRVMYISRGADHTLLLTRRGAVLKLRDGAIGMSFAGAHRAPRVSATRRLQSVSNYVRGTDPRRSIANIPNFERVVYKDLYDGVDLAFHASRAGELEFDYLLEPGVDPAAIRLAYRGAGRLRVDANGDLVLRGGEVRQPPPVVYQTIGGSKTRIEAAYVLHGGNEVGFSLKNYDPGAALLIDPVIRYSTYLGGADEDSAIWSDVDRWGNFYVTGLTASPDYPTTPGAYQSQSRGDLDVFVTKLDPTGSRLVWSTYLGGTGLDVAIGLDVDAAGNVVVTGATGSDDFPTTPGAYDRQFAGDLDTFVTKLDRSGSRLLFSTYLGGAGGEGGFISFFDARGNVYVEGETSSADFPTTRRAFQKTYGGGSNDGFVTKLNANGSALVYSTFIGGAGYDGAHDGWLDENGNFYIDGPTESANFPTTRGAYQRALKGPSDAFAAKLNPDGTGVEYSTYLGGSGAEDVADMTIDRYGNAYVPGQTDSPDFPTTSFAFQRGYGGNGDGFLTKLNPRGTGLEYSTYLGAGEFDTTGGVRVDRDGDAHVPGITASPQFPVTRDAFQRTYGGGPEDAFVLTLDRSGSRLKFSSFLGGSGDDGSSGAGEWLDDQGNFYVPGFTDSTDFPVTRRAFQRTNAGGYDVFLVKIAPTRADDDFDWDRDHRKHDDAASQRHGPRHDGRHRR
jgi:Beta-propeller repeat